jgi:hypothetical protein
MGNPLNELAELRKYDPSADANDYLHTDLRQNWKAIEDAFRKLGVSTAALTTSQTSINSSISSIPYSFYALKTTNMQTLTTTEVTITNWDSPTENIGSNGSFDLSTGLWTCNKTGTYLFFGRCGVAPNSGEEITIRFYLDNVAQAAAMNFSNAYRGPIVSFGRRVNAGQVVKLTAVCLGITPMDYSAINPIFFNVVQSGTT